MNKKYFLILILFGKLIYAADTDIKAPEPNSKIYYYMHDKSYEIISQIPPEAQLRALLKSKKSYYDGLYDIIVIKSGLMVDKVLQPEKVESLLSEQIEWASIKDTPFYKHNNKIK